MLTEEFFEKYPISVYHGTHFQDGTIGAKFSNPKIDGGIYLLSEQGMFEGIQKARNHQRRCPWDNRNLAEIAVKERALIEVQTEKRLHGLPLDAPPLQGPFVLTVIPGGREPS